MKLKSNWTIIVMFASHFIGYFHTIEIKIPPAETINVSINVHTHNNFRDQYETKTCQLLPGSAGHLKLTNWFAANTEGWEADIVTHAPNITIRSSSFIVFFNGTSAILNYNGGQYYHYINPAEYQSLLCPAST